MDHALAVAFALPLRHRFRGITVREGLLVRGPAGWAEWSPFAEYTRPEIDTWWQATLEAAELGFPEPVRARVPVNVTVPAVPAERAHAIVAGSGCRTAKVKVAEPGQAFADDLARVEAVRDALGPGGRLRVDVNGLWPVDEAERRLAELARFDLEYAEQPCATVAELAQLRRRLARRGLDVPIAADESIRRSGDPERVVAEEAADIAVLKVQPLGGVRRCLELAERLGLPVVVSSALESSVGLAAGVALAAALPELPYACGLNTATMFTTDVTAAPLVAVDGEIAVRPVVPNDADDWRAGDEATARWLSRLGPQRRLGSADRLAEPVETAATDRLVEPVETAATVRLVEPVETAATVRLVEPVETAATVRLVELVETAAADRLVEPVETAAADRLVEPVETAAADRSAEPDSPEDPSEASRAARNPEEHDE